MGSLAIKKLNDKSHGIAYVALSIAAVLVHLGKQQLDLHGVGGLGDFLYPGVIEVQGALEVHGVLVYLDLHLADHLAQHFVHPVFHEVVVEPSYRV